MAGITAISDYCKENGICHKINEPMKIHTTFKIGGPAVIFAEPSSLTQLSGLLVQCRQAGIKIQIVGNGSNLLVSDSGFDGAVICLGQKFSDIKLLKSGHLFAAAGASLFSLCRFAAEHSLTGLEFAFGIPGSVGGAVCMNAGAYESEMGHVLSEVTCLDESFLPVTLKACDCGFHYRRSCFMENGYTITSAVFSLNRGEKEQIKDRMDKILAQRVEKQPLEFPSAGSVFRRPNGAYASALIDRCGLKGKSVGGAEVSPKHAGFIVNTGDACCDDVNRLIDLITEEVQEKTGFTLECEIKRL